MIKKITTIQSNKTMSVKYYCFNVLVYEHIIDDK